MTETQIYQFLWIQFNDTEFLEKKLSTTETTTKELIVWGLGSICVVDMCVQWLNY